ncbi:MAG: HlyD family efflux transporter periplasmic adaptor subunit [Deltaproteobacteria bacterium]|nr:MAG: HlyD family efflux transporter periplasmic adaptor subunit [Deltaproteobacteria bacterium]
MKELTDLLRFDGPPHRFLAELIALQCRLVGADGGVVFRPGEKNRLEIVAMYPLLGTETGCLDWIAKAKEHSLGVISSGEAAVEPEDPTREVDDWPQRYLIILPVQNEESVRAAAAFVVEVGNREELLLCRERIELSLLSLNYYEIRWTLRQRNTALDRIRVALEILTAFNRSGRFMSAAMAFCNESATRWHCNRASLGFLNGRYVRVQAMSHTDKFSREMKLLQAIETTMEECLDQDVEVIHPAPEDATYVSRAAAQLSADHGPAAVLSLPIRQNGEVPAVMTLERTPEHPFSALGEIEAVRLACDLCAPRLVELHGNDRWVGTRMAASARRSLGVLLGPKHTWIKVWAVLVFLVAVSLTFLQGDYRIEAPFVFEAATQQVVVAPFDTFIKTVSAVTGDEVEAGKTTLGVLETSELRLKLAALKAEQMGYQKQMAASMRDQKTAEAQIAQAQSDKLAATIRLLEQNIGQATLVAPITGRVVSEDLKGQIGAPVETGKILFEIARIDSLRAELYVREELITTVKVGQKGELASVAHPDQRIPFVVERINPMADVVNDQNVFKVRVQLLERREWMRPGMEGIAKISAGKKRYVWIASYRLANWLRMKLWI